MLEVQRYYQMLHSNLGHLSGVLKSMGTLTTVFHYLLQLLHVLKLHTFAKEESEDYLKEYL